MRDAVELRASRKKQEEHMGRTQISLSQPTNRGCWPVVLKVPGMAPRILRCIVADRLLGTRKSKASAVLYPEGLIPYLALSPGDCPYFRIFSRRLWSWCAIDVGVWRKFNKFSSRGPCLSLPRLPHCHPRSLLASGKGQVTEDNRHAGFRHNICRSCQ